LWIDRLPAGSCSRERRCAVPRWLRALIYNEDVRSFGLKAGWERRKMRALVIDRPGEARVVEMNPSAADPLEATMRIRRVGLCGTDLSTFLGKSPLVTYPRIPGHEVAATLERVPANDLGLAEGMNVTMSPYTSCGECAACRQGRVNSCRFNQTLGVQRDGALMDHFSMPLAKLYAAPLPVEELCLVEPLTVGCHAVARGRVSAADTVAIYGCGGVGLGAVSAAAFRGANVIAIDLDDKKLAVAAAAGARHLIHSSRDDIHARLQQITNGNGPDVVIEAIGRPDTYRAAIEEVAFTGRVVYIGYAKDHVSFETRLFLQKELDILGSRNALPQDFKEVIRMFEQKRFPTTEAISATVPLMEAPGILRAWSENPAAYTKIMITFD
jgi:threonine dehydrogenase-like Zn-dependent dehydrogenase